MTDRDANRFAALVVGVAVLAGPRRTRPLAGFLFGAALSRAQGASRKHLEATLLRLFDERNSVQRRLDVVAGLLDGLRGDVDELMGRRRRIEP